MKLNAILAAITLISSIFCVCAPKYDSLIAQKQMEKTDNIAHFSVEESELDKTRLDIAYLVYTPDEFDEVLEKVREPVIPSYINNPIYSPSYFRRAGRISWGGWQWTWYSERILPGYGLRIPGRHTDADGYVRDANGYLCLASDVLRKGTVIETPFGGYGKVYDCGCGSLIDVYVGW